MVHDFPDLCSFTDNYISCYDCTNLSSPRKNRLLRTEKTPNKPGFWLIYSKLYQSAVKNAPKYADQIDIYDRDGLPYNRDGLHKKTKMTKYDG